jgi:hypothetical protein
MTDMAVAFAQPFRGGVPPELIANQRLFGGEVRLDAIIVNSRSSQQCGATARCPFADKAVGDEAREAVARCLFGRGFCDGIDQPVFGPVGLQRIERQRRSDKPAAPPNAGRRGGGGAAPAARRAADSSYRS